MNRTKVIYFLSAIVLIIGCYALNLSYSLFVETEEKEVVSASVPMLEYSLERSSFTVPAGTNRIIKLKVNNTGTVDINYGLVLNSTLNSGVTLSRESVLGGGDIVGTVKSGETGIIAIYVQNYSTEEQELEFSVDANYTTINFDTSKYLNDTVIDRDNYYLIEHQILKDALLNNPNVTINGTVPDIVSAATTELGMYTAEDDYGTSYYYRGAQNYNYVSFAGFTWRIVRVNGDGSIRLILSDTIKNVCGSTNSTVCVDSVFNYGVDDNAYVGYMYGDTGGVTYSYEDGCWVDTNIAPDGTPSSFYLSSETKDGCNKTPQTVWLSSDLSEYEYAHVHLYSSLVKNVVEQFYDTFLLDKYGDVLADSIFCGDKTRSDSSIGTDNTALGYGKNKTVYTPFERGLSISVHNKAIPTLECKDELSIYTKSAIELDGNVYKGSLRRPIGLLSSDELIFAGAFNSIVNNDYYLATSTGWWTMSPGAFFSDNAYEMSITSANKFNYTNVTSEKLGVRPVINLKADTIVPNVTSDGSESTPYEVVLVDE